MLLLDARLFIPSGGRGDRDVGPPISPASPPSCTSPPAPSVIPVEDDEGTAATRNPASDLARNRPPTLVVSTVMTAPGPVGAAAALPLLLLLLLLTLAADDPVVCEDAGGGVGVC